MSKVIYEINNLCKEFGSLESLVNALNKVSLKIYEGEFIAIMGPSGSGKTTFLNIIAGLIPATSGEVSFEGSDILKWKDKSLSAYRNLAIGYIIQNFGLIQSMNVYENVALPIKHKKNQNKKRVHGLLASLNIEMKYKSYPSELSGGQKQRVAIARSLVNNPTVLLADEPTGALDQQNAKKIMDILEKINDEGVTVILVTHDLNVARRCERVISFEDGIIVSDNIMFENKD